jgi:excisionase family DNA binding protein
MSGPKAWLTVAEAAAYAGVGKATIYEACLQDALRHARVNGRRAIRLRPAWIDAWLEGHAASRSSAEPKQPPKGSMWLDVEEEDPL